MKLRPCHSENFISLMQKQEIVVLTLFSLNNFYIPKFKPMKRAAACAAAPMCCFCPVCGELAARLYELEEYYLSVVALARAELEDPGVSALTVGVLRSDFLE